MCCKRWPRKGRWTRASGQSRALDPESVPETVRISILANEYQPAEFPHRAVYKKLLEGMDGNTLASAFHTQPLSTCAACHHKSSGGRAGHAAKLRLPPRH